MRMWMVPPAGMCQNHLLGEHNEIHMIVGAMRKPSMLPSLLGLAKVNCIDTVSIVQRHDALAWEMTRRGNMHHTEILQPLYIPPQLVGITVDWQSSLQELMDRCGMCRARMIEVLLDSTGEKGDPPLSWEMPDL